MSITGGPGGVSIGLAYSVMPSTYNKVTVDGYGTVTAGENVDYLTSQSIKKLNTNNTAAQDPNASEAIVGTGTINLHKVAKTGSYDDLSKKPTFVSSVNGSSGAITNVAKTDETNVFTNSQIILKPSDETQASLWNYSGCIGYSHWVQGSSSEPRIGIGYKNSGIRVFNGTTETPMQYYDVTMPSQAGQLVTDTFAKFTGETSGIGHPYRVFPDEEAYVAYQSNPQNVKYTSQTNAALIIYTDANNRTAFVDGRIDNKKNGTKYELTLPAKTGTLAITSDIPDVSGKANLSGGNTFTNGIQRIQDTTLQLASGAGNNDYLIDCFDREHGGETIFGVVKTGVDAGEVHIGDGIAKAPILLGNSAGTAGQVLTSQGAGNTPIWKELVTLDTDQDITGHKTFTTPQSGGPKIGIYNGRLSVRSSSTSEGGIIWDTPSDNIAADFTVDGNGAHLSLGVDAAADIVLNGDSGTAGQVLTSQGANMTPQWKSMPTYSLSGTTLTITLP